MDLYIREPTSDDTNFVLNSWMKSLRTAVPNIESDVFYSFQKMIILKLLSKATLLVACNPEDLDQIFGWIVFSNKEGVTVVHYVYVKQPFRLNGIANGLFEVVRPKEIRMATHWTKHFEILKDKWKLIYNPYLLADFA